MNLSNFQKKLKIVLEKFLDFDLNDERDSSCQALYIYIFSFFLSASQEADTSLENVHQGDMDQGSKENEETAEKSGGACRDDELPSSQAEERPALGYVKNCKDMDSTLSETRQSATISLMCSVQTGNQHFKSMDERDAPEDQKDAAFGVQSLNISSLVSKLSLYYIATWIPQFALTEQEYDYMSGVRYGFSKSGWSLQVGFCVF